jgi:Sulfatase-modifying factor enzyme 1
MLKWSLTVRDSKYLWGSPWPPPTGAGNFAGEEILDSNWPTNRPSIREYRDGFVQTSPVGSFAANRYGLFDLVGNLFEWCEDCFRKEMNSEDRRKENPAVDFAPTNARVLRGASWGGGTPGALGSLNHAWATPDARAAGIGFRVALVRVRDEDHKAIDFAMAKLESAFKAGDYSYTFEVMYTPMLESVGGKAKGMETAKAIEAQTRESQIIVVSRKAR